MTCWNAASLAILFGATSAAAFAWPSAEVGVPPPATATIALAFVVATFTLVLGIAAVGVAWRAGHWAPAFAAAAAIPMGSALAVRVLRLAAGDTGPGDLVTGYALAGLLLALSACPLPPARGRARSRARLALPLLAAGTGLAALVDVPHTPGTLLATAGATGYGWAALRYLGSYRYLRLAPQFALATACGLFLFLVPAILHAPARGMAGWEFEVMLLGAALVPIGILAEARARPGLRALALAHILPAALASLRRGDPLPALALVDEVACHDPVAPGHAARVAALAVRMGMRLRLNASHLAELAAAAHLHDIGKIVVPCQLLETHAPTPAAFAVLRTHAAIGEEIVRRCPGIAPAARAVGEHHERWDGAGYPLGKAGGQLSITGRILAVADEFDCLANRAVAPLDAASALAEVQRAAGTQFDPRLVEELARVLDLQAFSQQQHRHAA